MDRVVKRPAATSLRVAKAGRLTCRGKAVAVLGVTQFTFTSSPNTHARPSFFSFLSLLTIVFDVFLF